MSVYSTSLQNQTAYANAPGKPFNGSVLTGSGAKNVKLSIGRWYRIQAGDAPVYIGWGETSGEADTNAAIAAGDYLDAREGRAFCCTSAKVQYISRVPVSGTTEARVFEIDKI